MFPIIYIDPGITLYYLIKDTPKSYNKDFTYNSRGDIIVPVIAEEVDDIYEHPEGPDLPAVWRYRDHKGNDYCSVPTKEINENGWNKYEHKDPSWLGDAKSINQFVWIDEPIGHAIQVGDPYDGLFLTLDEAKRYAFPSKKKHLKRRLRAYRRRYCDFIASTWKRAGEVHPGFKKYPEKKIYVRKP